MKIRIVGIAVLMLLLVPALASAGIEPSGLAFQDVADEGTLALPALSIELTPHNPPIALPPDGGNLNDGIAVHYDGANSGRFQVWTACTLPDGSTQSPVFGPALFRVEDGWSVSRDDLAEYLPGGMPDGTYTYTAYVGRYPGLVLDTASFTFEKLAGGGWYQQTSGTTGPVFAVHFADAENGWAVGFDLLHTTDGGDNWYPQSDPIFAHYYDVFAHDAMTAWAVGDSAVILKTTDGGATWLEQELGYTGASFWNGVQFLDANTGWVVGGKPFGFTSERRAILKTTNGGATWTTQYYDSNQPILKAVYFVDASHGWAVGAGGDIMVTANGGSTWTDQDSGTGVELWDVHFVDVNTGWVVGIGGTLLHTTDGGATWNPQDPGTLDGFTAVYFDDASNGWISGGVLGAGAVLHTTDGGVTWHPQDTDGVDSLYDMAFTDGLNGWGVAYGGGIIHTETGGE